MKDEVDFNCFRHTILSYSDLTIREIDRINFLTNTQQDMK